MQVKWRDAAVSLGCSDTTGRLCGTDIKVVCTRVRGVKSSVIHFSQLSSCLEGSRSVGRYLLARLLAHFPSPLFIPVPFPLSGLMDLLASSRVCCGFDVASSRYVCGPWKIVVPRDGSISRPVRSRLKVSTSHYSSWKLARYCSRKFLRDKNKFLPIEAMAKWVSVIWRDDNSCRYRERVYDVFVYGAARGNNIYRTREFRRVFPRGRCNFYPAMTREKRTFPGMARRRSSRVQLHTKVPTILFPW